MLQWIKRTPYDFITNKYTDINQAKEIINFLMDEKLLYNPTFAEQQKFQKNDKNGKLESSIQILIRGQTKALLFDKINHQLAQ